MKAKLGAGHIGISMEIDARDIIKKVEDMAAADYINISAELDLKTISDQKLRWLRQGDRPFFKMNNHLEELFISLITFEDTLENSELVSTAERDLKDYLIERFEKPDIQVKPLKASTLKLKRRKGYPLQPGIATNALLDDIRKAKMEIKVAFGAGSKRKIKTP